MRKLWWQRKTFWAAASGIVNAAATCFAFAIDASPWVKAGFAFSTAVCAILEAAFVASRVSTEVAEVKRLVRRPPCEQ